MCRIAQSALIVRRNQRPKVFPCVQSALHPLSPYTVLYGQKVTSCRKYTLSAHPLFPFKVEILPHGGIALSEFSAMSDATSFV